MTQIAAPADAQVKARSWTPALSLKAEMGMMPFLIVDAVLAPTARAPVISKIRQRIIACRYVTDRDDTLVAQALATSSGEEALALSNTVAWEEKLTGTVVVRLEQGKEGANGENVGILGEYHLGERYQERLGGKALSALLGGDLDVGAWDCSRSAIACLQYICGLRATWWYIAVRKSEFPP
jgi:hypothetical protein